MTPEHEQAAQLLGIIWKGIPADYKSRYRRSIWQQFEDNIRSAAYTSNLGKFINSLCSKLSAQIGRNSEDRAQAEAIILQQADAGAMLKLLREETTLLVLMVRVANQERRETWEAEHQELEGEGQDEDALF